MEVKQEQIQTLPMLMVSADFSFRDRSDGSVAIWIK